MPFNIVTNLADLLRERRRDTATIATIEQSKRDGRDVTGRRAEPSAFDNIIEGDAVGDYINTATHHYECQKISGVTLWAKIAQDTTF